ncbi:MAG: hypothetical protein COA77_08740, partial [Thaumarchaeota archaeon]
MGNQRPGGRGARHAREGARALRGGLSALGVPPPGARHAQALGQEHRVPGLPALGHARLPAGVHQGAALADLGAHRPQDAARQLRRRDPGRRQPLEYLPRPRARGGVPQVAGRVRRARRRFAVHRRRVRQPTRVRLDTSGAAVPGGARRRRDGQPGTRHAQGVPAAARGSRQPAR